MNNQESDSESGFLSRWSQRKQQHRVDETRQGPALEPADATAAEPAPVVADTADSSNYNPEPSRDTPSAPTASPQEAAAAEEVTEEVLLSDEDMPPLDTLQKDSDVSMFFNRGVSPELRKAALRKLFSLPALNITDGLNDYDEDYTTFEPLGDIVTADMRYHAERKARLAEEEEAARAQLETSDKSIADGESGQQTAETSDHNDENEENEEIVDAIEPENSDELRADEPTVSTDSGQPPESHGGEPSPAHHPDAHARQQQPADPEQTSQTTQTTMNNATRHSLIDDGRRDRAEAEGKLSRHE